MTRHQLHIWPWTRRIGRLVLPNWLAVTVGRHVIAWRPLTRPEREHELEHVRQWVEHGWRFPIAYLVEAIRAHRSGAGWYRENRFEVAARRAATEAVPR